MNLPRQLFTNTAGLVGAAVIRTWMNTLDYKAAFYDPTIDPIHPDNYGRKIYVFWHEHILFPMYLRGHCNLVLLLSRHSGANILGRIALHLGYDIVRGSTTSGGMAALRKLTRRSRSMHLTLTPDGPLGPRRTFAQGAIYLASKLDMPIVPMGFGYDRPWRAKSWDRFAVPRPFSRARAVLGPEISIPQRLSRVELERHRQRIENMMNLLTDEAEAWATAGTRKVCEVPLHSASVKTRTLRISSAEPPAGARSPLTERALRKSA